MSNDAHFLLNWSKCTKFDSIMQVIYIDREKEWTKDRSLWDSMFHISSFRGISIN